MYASDERVRVHKDGVPDLATVRAAVPSGDTSGWTLFLLDDDGGIHEIELTADDTHTVTKIQTDGAADSARVLAGMWTRWMSAAATNAESSAIASTHLRPTPIRPPPSTARCSPSHCFGSSWQTNPEPVRRSWPGCTCARCNVSDWYRERSSCVPRTSPRRVISRQYLSPRPQ
jgi:hypothetical protein